ncbi:MAG TPA: chemotaxis protein [Cyanobacteria bacterium UBA11149]|nr:chemotaxis protein [Cyanobacteria bacterium UBA11367]HBE60731.1 chemotaxis protein [Cyanobacteria bacterium UBA11366]HBK65462.1 chemotaxis protein [Cyanobacteria bacterium UBA11166]HBR72459.1 chemotaxis protein [Cyanobacteria bacterium UBA11159]HBS68270.1 chemotaxis protein [Cyanobacteria bacterium UBA11153]HBW91389.1 chemotaxis protein [Cyanobacteria bacterium UBA11149]HCA96178.1 chemotaxis protein [Cyanobacteria bacterium UBA9226]
MQELAQLEPRNNTSEVELNQSGSNSNLLSIEQQLKDQRQQLVAIIHKMSQATSTDALLQITITEIRDRLKVDRALIYRFQSEKQGMVLAESMLLGYTPSLGESLPALIFGAENQEEYDQEQVVFLDNIYQNGLSPYHIQLLEKFQVKASLSLPIQIEGQMWGLLVVQQCATPRLWQEAEINFLCRIVSELRISLHPSEIRIQKQKRELQDKIIAKVANKIQQSQDTISLFETTTQEVRQQLKCDRVAVYRFEPDWSGKFVAESVTPGWVPLVGPSIQTVWADTHLQDTRGGRYRNYETFVVEDIYKVGHEPCHIEILEQFQVKAYIIAPIFQGEKLWGLLAAYQNSATRFWQPEEVNFITQIGRQFGLAVLQAEYMEKLRAQSTRFNKAEEIERLAAKVSDRLRQPSNVDNLFRNATQEVRQMLNCDRVAVYRFNPDWGGEFVAESVGQGWVKLVGPDVQKVWTDTNLQETQGGRYAKGESLAIDDIYKADHAQCHIDILEQFQAKAYILVPIFQGQKLWGLLAAYQNDRPRHWESLEVSLLNRIARQFGIALQQAEYTEQMERQNTLMAKAKNLEQSAIKIIDQNRQSLEMNLIFKTTVIETRQLLKADRVCVFRFYPDSGYNDGEVVAEDVVSNYSSAMSVKVHDHCFGEQFAPLYLDGRIQAISDIYSAGLSSCHVELLSQFQVRANLIAPLVKGNQLWGLFCIHQCSGPRDWDEIEIDFVKRVGAQLGVSLQFSDYIDRVEAQSAQLKKVTGVERSASRAIDKIRKTTDVESICRVTTQEVRQQLRCDRVAVYQFLPDWSGKFISESVAGSWVRLVGPDIETIWPDTYLQETKGGRYAKKESFAVDDIYQAGHSPCHVEILEQFEVKAYLLAPIFTGDKLWGILGAYQNSSPRHWEETDINFLSQISLQFGVALQQVQYIEQLQTQSIQLSRAAELERGAVKIVNSIRQTVNLEKIFQTTVQETRLLLGADRVGVYRFDSDLGYDYGEFVTEDVLSGYKSALEVKIKDHCFGERHAERYKSGNIFTLTDISNAGLLDCYVATLEQFQIRASLVVPILKNRDLWGLFCIYQCNGPREWQKNEIEFAKQIAAQLGVALQQAEYIEQLQATSAQLAASAQREKGVTKIIARILRSLDAQTIFHTTTQEIRYLLECDRVLLYRLNSDNSGEFVAESVGSDWVGLLNSPIQPSINYLLGEGGSQISRYRQRENLVVPNISQAGYPANQLEVLEQLQAKALVVIPVFVGENLWGLLSVYQNKLPRHWEETEVGAISQIALQMGAAIQLVDYLERVQQQSKALTTLAQREANFISLIDSIGQRIAERLRNRNFNYDSLFRTITQELRQLLTADRVAIYRFHPDWSGEFLIEDVSGSTMRLAGTSAAIAIDPILQETEGGQYRKNESSTVEDINQVKDLTFPKELLMEWGVKAYTIAPIFQGEKLWGLLVTHQNSEPRVWEKSEINLLVQISRQLGIVLQQAEFVEQIQTQSQQLAEAAAREKADKEVLQRHVIQLLSSVRPALQGNLTVRAPITEDEVGTVADAYNNTLQSLRGIIKQVQESSRKVAQTSLESESSITSLTNQAQQQFQALNLALGQIEKMVNSTKGVESSAQQVEVAVQQANQTVRQGDGAMNRTVEGILDIRETVAETSKRLKRLSESTQKVSRVVNLISNFTTQTQLLALNASIEATRAGEYGRGFVVVADEVRSLARQSAEATSEIEQLVQEIQQGTAEVSTAMETGIQQVAQGTTLVSETRQNLNAIVEATAQISQLVQGITQATQLQTSEFESVTQTMSQVATIANQTSDNSIGLATSFKELLTMAQNLQSSADQFKVD